MQGRRLVLALAGLIVAVAGVAGLLFGVVIDGATAPRLFFLVPLPPTPLGFALYGVLTVGTVFAVGLALVEFVSRWAAEVDGE